MTRLQTFITTVATVGLALSWSAVALAESPPCMCRGEAYSIAVEPALDCLTWQKDSLDFCDGGDFQVSVVNTCAFDVTFKDVHGLQGEVADQTIAAGKSTMWSEIINPPLLPGSATKVDASRQVYADGKTHKLQLQADVKCDANAGGGGDGGDGGCRVTATGQHAAALLWMMLLAIVSLVWRRSVGCNAIEGGDETR